MGLFLGMSMLSPFELLELLIEFLTKLVTRYRISKANLKVVVESIPGDWVFWFMKFFSMKISKTNILNKECERFAYSQSLSMADYH